MKALSLVWQNSVCLWKLPIKKSAWSDISEVAGEYVSDVNDYLKLHDKVKVKIISVDEKGKIALSIKQAQAEVCGRRKPDQHTCEHSADIRRDSGASRIDRAVMQRKEMRYSYAGRNDNPRPSRKHDNPASFEDKLSRFLKDSDERLLDLKRNVESKRGGRGARRTD